LLFKNGSDSGSATGWVVLGVGGIVAVAALLFAFRLLMKGRAALRSVPKDVIYDTSQWTDDMQASVKDALATRGAQFEWNGHELRVDERYEHLVDERISTW
jgi:hypothetical protein